MPKGYWIAHVSSDNADNFTSDAYKAYVAGAAPMFEKYGATFLARGGEYISAEGQDMGSRHVVIEFPSLEAAKDCYDSPEYQEARKNRTPISNGTIVLIEGIDS